MHGNDILDAVLAQYSVYFRSKRWTMQLASWVIDVAVACGFINANYFGIPRSSDCLHAAWIEKLIDGLIEKTGIQNLNSEINSNNFVHYPVHLGAQNNRKMCVVCYKTNKKQTRTYFKCNYCDVGLCVDKSCWKDYHTVEINLKFH